MPFKRKRVEKVTKKVPYKKAAENTVNKLLSKNDRIEKLVEKISYTNVVKTPLTNWYTRLPVKDQSYKEAAQITVGKALSQKALILMIAKQLPNKLAAKNTVNP